MFHDLVIIIIRNCQEAHSLCLEMRQNTLVSGSKRKHDMRIATETHNSQHHHDCLHNRCLHNRCEYHFTQSSPQADTSGPSESAGGAWQGALNFANWDKCSMCERISGRVQASPVSRPPKQVWFYGLVARPRLPASGLGQCTTAPVSCSTRHSTRYSWLFCGKQCVQPLVVSLHCVRVAQCQRWP